MSVSNSKEEKLLEIAIDERCKVIVLIEKLKDVANNPDWTTRGLSKTNEEYIARATEEIEELLLREGF
jgi:hypothetical protein